MSEISEKRNRESHEGTVDYEIQMMRHCAGRIRLQRDADASDKEPAVYLECFLLHYRNVAQFLSGKGAGNLNMTSREKWSSKQLTKRDVVEVTRAAIPIYDRYCGDISKYLSHCTQERCKTETVWHPQEMLGDIEPAIGAFERLFPPNICEPAIVVRCGGPDAFSTATMMRNNWSG